MNKIYRVELQIETPGEISTTQDHVVARSNKEALIAVFENLHESDPAWQSLGIRVQVFEANRAFIL